MRPRSASIDAFYATNPSPADIGTFFRLRAMRRRVVIHHDPSIPSPPSVSRPEPGLPTRSISHHQEQLPTAGATSNTIASFFKSNPSREEIRSFFQSKARRQRIVVRPAPSVPAAPSISEPHIAAPNNTMPTQFPSIQSFFSSSPSKTTDQIPSSSSRPSTSQLLPSTADTEADPGDGFTEEELAAVLQPSSAQWSPSQDYEEADIGTLEPCPKFVTFTGRIVNFYDMAKPSKKPMAAKGCLKLMVADDTGALTVRTIPGTTRPYD